MKTLLLILGLVLALACRKPEPAPPAPVQLTVHFLDRPAVLGLPRPAPPGNWAFMDAGLWRPLEILWHPGGLRGTGVVPRTAPQWVLLRDPEGEIHRIVLVAGDLEADQDPRLDPEEREALAALGLLWVLSRVRP